MWLSIFRILFQRTRFRLKVELLYVLARGDTTATVWDLAFSLDSRWAAAATARGTVHIFPIAPYGGRASVRTHMAPRVVNKLSRYHRSVGVDRDVDMPLVVQPSAQIRHSINCGVSESIPSSCFI